MRAQEKLDFRNAAILQLREIDLQLAEVFGLPPSTRASSAGRSLLAKRAKFADRIAELGGQPTAVPVHVVSEAV